MEFTAPQTVQAAIELRARDHDWVPVAGGTDVLVELNFDRRRPQRVMDISRIDELHELTHDVDRRVVRIGAGVPFTRIIAETGHMLPGLALAARTVGSPQIRNRGTLGGNLATASPAGDSLPPLVAAGATVCLRGAEGERRIPVAEFMRAPKQSALRSDELIVAVEVPEARGPQQFSKLGTRNAMVISVCSCAVNLDIAGRHITAAIGSAGPTIIEPSEACEGAAERIASAELWDTRAELPGDIAQEFGLSVAAAARPIDDVRGTAAYRRHALSVVARRELTWAWEAYRQNAGQWKGHEA